MTWRAPAEMEPTVAAELERLVAARDCAELERDALARRAELGTNRIGLLRSMQTSNAIHHLTATL